MKNVVTLFVLFSIQSAFAEPFTTVTATNGKQWLEQCEKPATKSDHPARLYSCLSYLKGAMDLITMDPSKVCKSKMRDTPPGAWLDTTLYLAQEKPTAPLGAIMEATARTIAPPCK